MKASTLQNLHLGFRDEIKREVVLRYGGHKLAPTSMAKKLLQIKNLIICPEDVNDDRLFVFTIPSGFEQSGRLIYDPNIPLKRCQDYFMVPVKRKSDDKDDEDTDNTPNKKSCLEGEVTDDEELETSDENDESTVGMATTPESPAPTAQMLDSEESLFVPETQ